ncbi:MAG: hypothetical protein E6689_10300 [Corynebacterium striatum]|nr:hypothetical protein [Corynebacterium striatum]
MTFVDTIDWASHDPEAVFFDALRVRDTAERVEALTAMLEFGWAPPTKLLPELADNPELCAQDAPVIEKLIAAGADPNAVNRFGETVWVHLVHSLASDEEQWPVYQALLTAEPDLQISARSLFNPLLNKRHFGLLALLRPYLPAQSISVPVDPATL